MVSTSRIAAFGLALLTLTLGFARSPWAADAGPAKLELLKWNAFEARLAQAKAKNYRYTLVDAWATNCGPCKENFPHLIAMDRKYGPRGLQVISLSLDDNTDTKAVEEARAFLKEKNATFLNVLLDEDLGVGYDKLDISAIPAVFLYGPDGKLLKKYTLDDPNNQFTYDQVEKEVSGLLDGKPLPK